MSAVRVAGCCSPGLELLALLGEAIDTIPRKHRRTIVAHVAAAIAEPRVVSLKARTVRADRAAMRELFLRFIHDRARA